MALRWGPWTLEPAQQGGFEPPGPILDLFFGAGYTAGDAQKRPLPLSGPVSLAGLRAAGFPPGGGGMSLGVVGWWPLALYIFLVFVVVGVMMGLSAVLGERHRQRTTAIPFESGILPTGSAHLRFHANFFRLAVRFVLRDVETVFLLAWVLNVRGGGGRVFGAMALFILLLLVALFYLARRGVLDLVRPPARPEER